VSFTVDLPSGGQLELLSADEVDVWNHTSERYIQDYGRWTARSAI
jgi:hypothetical protein